MPTYDYACEACGHAFEREQRISEDPIKKCPKCGKNKARRMIAGGAGFILKGGGWYADLYSSKPESKGDAGSSGDSDSAKAEGSETKSDTKSDAKSESPSKADKPAATTKKKKKASSSKG